MIIPNKSNLAPQETSTTVSRKHKLDDDDDDDDNEYNENENDNDNDNDHSYDTRHNNNDEDAAKLRSKEVPPTSTRGGSGVKKTKIKNGMCVVLVSTFNLILLNRWRVFRA